MRLVPVKMPAWKHHVVAVLGYLAVAVAFSWPLPLHFSTHLTGDPRGDTGVYVWNTWVFRHETIDHRHSPLFTEQIFSLAPQADLSLHNYTIFADLLALPLLPRIGVVATFNTVYLMLGILTAYAMYLLAFHVCRSTAEAWLAGMLFAFSPVLLARGTSHFSLVAAAPLPVFLLLLMRSCDTGRMVYAAGAGAALAWAALSDAYYPVYCLLVAVFYVASRALDIHRRQRPFPHGRIAARLLDVTITCVLGLIAAIALTGGREVMLLGQKVGLRSLYTPVLILTALGLARLVLRLRPALSLRSHLLPGRFARAFATFSAVALLATSPILYALGSRIVDGRYVSARIYWRSSPPGADALAYVLPNPNHALIGGYGRKWLETHRPGEFAENVASLSLVALAVFVVALSKYRFRPPRFWIALTALFIGLSFGPFITVAGVNTYLPTPWTFLRFLPVVSNARSPSRFAVLATMGAAILFALALAWIGRHHPRKRPWLVGAIGLALFAELIPAPRKLYSAEIPAFYNMIAADRRDVRVMELPVGIRDGISSVGNFSASSQFYQTLHGKPLVGGYLSRVSARRVRQHRRMPVLDALLTLSEGKPLAPWQARRAWARRKQFLERARLGYVVIDTSRASRELRDFAIALLGLTRIAEAGTRQLYVPTDPSALTEPTYFQPATISR